MLRHVFILGGKSSKFEEKTFFLLLPKTKTFHPAPLPVFLQRCSNQIELSNIRPAAVITSRLQKQIN